jgi:hypothetical protein
MAFGIHFSSWSALRKQNVTTGGNPNTNALSAAEGIVNSHIKLTSTIVA